MKFHHIFLVFTSALAGTSALAIEDPRINNNHEGGDPEEKDAPQVVMARCIADALKHSFKYPGCAERDDWDCLCYNGEFVQVIKNAFQTFCSKTFANQYTIRGLERVHCKPLGEMVLDPWGENPKHPKIKSNWKSK
ncbi:hypothetical protein QBC35DRAFT_452230 [Podospora australis]|uniref:Extracellular membrane protein CFEM domain-containing protein n=1 Tax=Podospora australis TaxID=1536484 RepID=A0AAN7AIQ4_9PEZI|nr:hypothetical protein QBC35DRAFT_452230 [Podospora australis]